MICFKKRINRYFTYSSRFHNKPKSYTNKNLTKLRQCIENLVKKFEMKDAKIVIIDDEIDILEILRYNFEKERANVHAFTSGYRGLEYIQQERPDIVVCDWMLEDIDGIEICKIIRKDNSLKDMIFIMLTAKSDEIDVVMALEMEADDYVVKPIRIKELISRINRNFKKLTNKKPDTYGTNEVVKMPFEESSAPKMLAYKEISMDVEKHKVYLNNTEMYLTHAEFKLLNLFLRKPGKAFSRNQMIEKLNGMDYLVTERSIDVQLVGLRKKLGNYKDYLETIRGVGYRLKE